MGYGLPVTGFMSFTMQNYKKYFNVASDINIFLIIVYLFLKKQPPAIELMVIVSWYGWNL